MAGVLYFVSGRESITIPETGDYGLGYAFGQHLTARGVLGAGPDGKPGVVFADDRRVKRLGYHKDGQTWQKVPASEAWVGWETDDRPVPDDLQRDDGLSGHPVELADGNKWIIPVARAIDLDADALDWACLLPRRTSVDASGRWTRDEVVERYAPLWDVATQWWDHVTQAAEDHDPDQSTVTFDFDGLHDAALVALASNYRVGKAEVSALGLFDDGSAVGILSALVDWPTVLQWREKKTGTGG